MDFLKDKDHRFGDLFMFRDKDGDFWVIFRDGGPFVGPFHGHDLCAIVHEYARDGAAEAEKDAKMFSQFRDPVTLEERIASLERRVKGL